MGRDRRMNKCMPECGLGDLFVLGKRGGEQGFAECSLLICRKCGTLTEICQTAELDRWGSKESTEAVVNAEYAEARYGLLPSYIDWALKHPREHTAKLNELLRAKKVN